jgi:hypothetical protein
VRLRFNRRGGAKVAACRRYSEILSRVLDLKIRLKTEGAGMTGDDRDDEILDWRLVNGRGVASSPVGCALDILAGAGR